MALISIRERASSPDGFTATVSFDGLGEYPVTVRDPFAPGEEQLLEWYFEEHLRFPFVRQVEAQAAAASIARYGEALFGQVFDDRQAFARYSNALLASVTTLQFEIAGSPQFHGLHWEALKDPELPRAFVLEAPMVRKNIVPQVLPATLSPSPTINVLVVTARPHMERDVAYRTISRPLVDGLRQAGVPVRIDILRPGTFRALVQHLLTVQEQRGTGYYHVIHFDVHGGLLTYESLQQGAQTNAFQYQTRFGRLDLSPFEGRKAFLFLEGDPDTKAPDGATPSPADPVEATELAQLLITHQVPIAVLNACQSGKQVGDTETSLGNRLMQAGVQLVLAMGYSVTVSAAELLMQELYTQLFSGAELPNAIRRARLTLHNQKSRAAYFNQHIDLEDWLLPVVYQNQAVRLPLRPFTPEEQAAFYERHAARYAPPEPTYGFVGRDLDILHIEQRLLTRRNVLLLRGMGGVGKTTLLRHLGTWWQTTQFVDQVFYFGYDAQAWTRQQLLDALARQLFSPVEYLTHVQPLSLDAQQALLSQRLRAQRHLLILDNLESITGAHLAIQHTLSPAEQVAVQRFLRDLQAGRTLVLLGSRGGEAWLAEGTFGENVYELPGLDPEAASTLADRILERYQATQYRQDPALPHLLKLLAGYPLALEVVLANLQRQAPGAVLAALQTGEMASIDRVGIADKTESILRCIDYSHSNLSPDAQGLLACLAPFTAVIDTEFLSQYTDQLRQQPALARLPFERWPEVLQEATNWGLLSPHPIGAGYVQLQPIFPYFLRNRLQSADQVVTQEAVATSFREHYDGLSRAISSYLNSKKATERQIGQVMANLEYENLVTALTLALAAQVSVRHPFVALSNYLNVTQDQRRGLELGEMVRARLETYPADTLAGPIGADVVVVLNDIANRNLRLKEYRAAEKLYQRALSLLTGQIPLPAREKAIRRAGINHQLGIVAQEQRQWTQAEEYYQQALQHLIEFDARYEQARTYHQLGTLAQKLRQWTQAEQHYQQALQIKIEFDDRYEQACTYHNLGWVAQEQRQWTQAEEYYQQALQLLVEFDDRYEQADTYHNLGVVAREQRQWTQAKEYYQQALQLFIEFDNRYEQARIYNQLGWVAQEQRQWTQAEQYCQQALQLFIEFDARYEQARTYGSLGVVAYEQGQWTQAEQYYQQALQLFIEFDDRLEQARLYYQIGMVPHGQGQWTQAEQYYQQALQLFIEFDARYEQAGTYLQLGSVAQGQRQWTQARATLLKALALAMGFEDEPLLEMILRSLASLWRASGDTSLPATIATMANHSPEEVESVLRRLEG